MCDHKRRQEYFATEKGNYDAIRGMFHCMRKNNSKALDSAFQRLSPSQVMTVLYGGKYCEGNKYGLASPCWFNFIMPGLPASVHEGCDRCALHCVPHLAFSTMLDEEKIRASKLSEKAQRKHWKQWKHELKERQRNQDEHYTQENQAQDFASVSIIMNEQIQEWIGPRRKINGKSKVVVSYSVDLEFAKIFNQHSQSACHKCKDFSYNKKQVRDQTESSTINASPQLVSLEASVQTEIVHKTSNLEASVQTEMDGDETNLCVICLASLRTHLLQPCGHLILCEGCSNSLFKDATNKKKKRASMNCMYCRTPITGFQRVVAVA